MTERETEIRQHLGWLQSYILGMTEANWADMRLRAERQLHQLAALFPDGEQ